MLKIENITKKFGNEVILENASYTFPSHGLVCLMGPSGSGKTTLLNLIAGFDSDYQGDIISCGKSLSELDKEELCAYRRDCVGFVFQNYHLLTGYSVLENVMVPAELISVSHEESSTKAEELLERLAMAEKAKQSVETLSGGQKQRVAIARALMGNPQIILADEPTGALDRKTSNEIMELLKELSADRLVLIITHDAKVCDFADEVIHIQDKKIVAERTAPQSGISGGREAGGNKGFALDGKTPVPRKRAGRNFRVHLKRYIAAAAAISIGILAFLFSLSFGNVMNREINDFQEKNTVFNNGYIKGTDDGTILQLLQNEPRIEQAYNQYVLNNIKLSVKETEAILEEKLPLPKTAETLSYGVMPRNGENEIALTPSLAKKFAADIKNLLGESLKLTLGDRDYELRVSGIYNAGYDDFFVSSDVEQLLYEGLENQDNYSISYDVAEFEDVVAVSNFLKLRGVNSRNASAEVYAMQESFRSLEKMFRVISVLVLFLALFLCSVLLVKLQNSRYRELGLLSAVGFNRRYIRSMIRWENLLLSAFSAGVTAVMLSAAALVCKAVDFPLEVGIVQFLSCMCCVFVIVICISSLAGAKLIRTEPAQALKHD